MSGSCRLCCLLVQICGTTCNCWLPPSRIAACGLRAVRRHPPRRHNVYREVRLHGTLHHPNIVQLYAAWEDEEDIYLVQVRARLNLLLACRLVFPSYR